MVSPSPIIQGLGGGGGGGSMLTCGRGGYLVAIVS